MDNSRLDHHCMACGQPLAYLAQPRRANCHYCGQELRTLICCPEGHVVCDACHGADTLTRLERLAGSTKAAAPEDILEELLRLPQLPMHGPEHHAMAGLALM
ncbi:MAG: radical SAM protein, partial [Desulfuromonadales bacterium]|nr:radical SAM protein [Desulfuromonadales bacterium]NIR33427.1 radical SAM protein [Desulfuromonadales bacterium]NIS42172.1 radical SAM protein [Desulfuromonadales bacterium]